MISIMHTGLWFDYTIFWVKIGVVSRQFDIVFLACVIIHKVNIVDHAFEMEWLLKTV